MKRLVLVCVLFALAAQAFGGNDGPAVLDSHEQMQMISAYNRQMDTLSMRMDEASRSRPGSGQLPRNPRATLARLRKELAKTWQNLGLSPEAATTVASVYTPHVSPKSRGASLNDATDQQFASLIQSALASKDYQQADQTLIDFITKRMSQGKQSSTLAKQR